MKYREGITKALQRGGYFNQGNYVAVTENCDYTGGYVTTIHYYGHKVFKYTLNPLLQKPDNEKFEYDFCGYESHPRTTKLINCCLDAVGAKYRVKTVKGEVVEVPISKVAKLRKI